MIYVIIKSTMNGNDIIELRRKWKMTQEKFANYIGVASATISRWENDHTEISHLSQQQIERKIEEYNQIIKTRKNTKLLKQYYEEE